MTYPTGVTPAETWLDAPKTKTKKSQAMQDRERTKTVKAELKKKYDLISAAATASATPRGAGVVAAASAAADPSVSTSDAAADEILDITIGTDFKPYEEVGAPSHEVIKNLAKSEGRDRYDEAWVYQPLVRSSAT